MNIITCFSCNSSLNSDSNFCFSCGVRIKCSSCNTILVKEAKFCSECGASIELKATNNFSEKNTVNYRKTKDGVFCDVSLSNEVGKEGIKDLIKGLTNNQTITYQQLDKGKLADNTEENEKDKFEEAEVIITKVEKKFEKTKDTFPHINDVEMRVNCNEGQWILIYAFYESEFAQKTFTKKAVYDRYMSKRKTDTRVKSFSIYWKNLFKNYISTVNETTFKFKPEKLDSIKDIISGKEKTINSRNKKSTKLSKPIDPKELKIESKKSTKLTKSNSLSYKLVSDLNFYPSDKKSLKDFYSDYKAKGPENILLFVHYLQNILERKNIDVNAIYTCYKHIPIEVPNIDRAISNIKTRQGWVDSKNYSDLKLTVGGENHFQFRMTKNNS